MEPATLLENGNKTLLPFSIPVLPETILSALSNLKSFLKIFGVIFKPRDFPKVFSPIISLLKFLYPVFLILSVPILALAISFCYLYHWSITGVGLGCRFHLPRPASSIQGYKQIDSNFQLIEGTFFVSFWNSGPLDKDAMEHNLFLKSDRVVRHPDLKTSLGPGGNTKILVFDTGFIVSFKQMVSKPLATARLIVEALCNGIIWILKALCISIIWILKALYTSVTWIIKALYTVITWILKTLYNGVIWISKQVYAGVTWYLKALYADFIFQTDPFWRVFQELGTSANEELHFSLRWYVEGWCAAGRWIAKTISAIYQNLKAQCIRINRNIIRRWKKIGRIIASAYRSGRDLLNFGIWVVVQCFQNRLAIVMFLPNCVGMLLLWGMHGFRFVGRFLLYNRIGQFITFLLVLAMGLLIQYRINPLNWFQLPGPQPYLDTKKFRPKTSIQYMRPRRVENRAQNGR